MTETTVIDLPDETATLALGARLARLSVVHGCIFLRGELGAGKTTLVRGFLQALGHRGPVKSPTYTLIEPYHLGNRAVFHLDIYRLSSPEELDYLGIRDLMVDDNILLIEWPERAAGILGKPDLQIDLEYKGTARYATLSSPHTEVMQSISQDALIFENAQK